MDAAGRAKDETALPIDRPIVLLAEDDRELRSLIRHGLTTRGYRVHGARDGREALRCLERLIRLPRLPIGPDLVISDLRMPGFNGLQLLLATRLIDSELPVILITGFGDDHTHRIARELRVNAIFDKPFDIQELMRETQRLVPA